MTDTSPQRPLLGGRYELYRRLARGGMAEVFLGRDQMLDRPVAVKVLFREFSVDGSFAERFRREAQAAANLRHPNVVGVYDWGVEGGTHYIVMEYVDGRSLAEIIRAEGPLDFDRATDIAIDIASALAFAHANSVIHRDIKPGNVLVTAEGRVKVTDFGIARAISNVSAELTQTGAVMGTATYLSPEQAQGYEIDQRSDLYSLSVVLYEMLTSGPPFTGENAVAITYKHVREAPTPPTKFNADIPPALEAVCLRGLEKDPRARFDSANDMRVALELSRHRSVDPTLTESAQEVGGDPLAADATQVVPVVAPAGTSSAGQTPSRHTGAVPPSPPVSEASPAPTGAAPATAAASPTGPAPPTGGPPATPMRAGPPGGTGVWVALVVTLTIVVVGLGIALFVNLRSDDEPADTTTVEEVQPLRVPEVVGLNWEDADQALRSSGFVRSAGFEVDFRFQENDEIEENLVFGQIPEAGTSLEPSTDATTMLTLFVSSGAVTVQIPAVVGLTYAAAAERLSSMGLQVARNDIRDDVVEAGVVIDQSVRSGDERPQGAEITLTVSSGRGEVIVPDLVAQSLSDAQITLARLQLQTVIERENSTLFPEDTVMRTSPQADTGLERDSVVTLVVSDGPATITVPSLAELDATEPVEVESALAALGFNTRIEETERTADDPQLNEVGELIPEPGTTLLAGSEVVLVVYVPEATVVMPSLAELGTTDVAEVIVALEELGLTSEVVPFAVAAGDVRVGQVVSLQPVAGTELVVRRHEPVRVLLAEEEIAN